MTGEEKVPALKQFSMEMQEDKNALTMEASKEPERCMKMFADAMYHSVKGFKWIMIIALLGKPVLQGLVRSVGMWPVPLITGSVAVVPVAWCGIQYYNLQKKSKQKKQTLALREEKMSELKHHILRNRKTSSKGLTSEQNPNRSNEPSKSI